MNPTRAYVHWESEKVRQRGTGFRGLQIAEEPNDARYRSQLEPYRRRFGQSEFLLIQLISTFSKLVLLTAPLKNRHQVMDVLVTVGNIPRIQVSNHQLLASSDYFQHRCLITWIAHKLELVP